MQMQMLELRWIMLIGLAFLVEYTLKPRLVETGCWFLCSRMEKSGLGMSVQILLQRSRLGIELLLTRLRTCSIKSMAMWLFLKKIVMFIIRIDQFRYISAINKMNYTLHPKSNWIFIWMNRIRAVMQQRIDIQINQLYNFIAMSIMYQNKTYKGPTLEYEQKPAKQTTCFASKKQRFNYKVQRSPGPGSYQYQTTNYKTPQYHVKKDLDRQSPIKREHQWIWGSDRLSYVSNHNYSAYIGPGSYNLGVAGRGAGHTNWGKSQRFYYSKNGDYMTAPGPGAYESQGSKLKRGFGSVFKSKSPRTFIEKLLSQSSIPELKKSEMAQFIQNPEMPEKSSDQSQSKQKQGKQKKLNNSVFASKIPRFAQNNHNSNENIGPGSYEVPELSKSRSKQKLPKIIIIKGEQRKRKIEKQDSQLPGPGSYDLNMKTIQKELQGKRSVVICNQPRFVERTEKMPGPGQYLESKKNAFRAQFQKSQKLSPQKPSFNSSSDRSPPELPTKSNPLCAYNLEYFDLQYRIKKSKEHLQKLKIMQVTIPAFNSKARR